MLDTPRLLTNKIATYTKNFGIEDPEKTRSFFYVALDHARMPGTFDYTQPQTYHAVFPDEEQDAYVELNGKSHRKLAISNYTV